MTWSVNNIASRVWMEVIQQISSIFSVLQNYWNIFYLLKIMFTYDMYKDRLALQQIWRWDTCRFHLRIPNHQLSCRDLTIWKGDNSPSNGHQGSTVFKYHLQIHPIYQLMHMSNRQLANIFSHWNIYVPVVWCSFKRSVKCHDGVMSLVTWCCVDM